MENKIGKKAVSSMTEFLIRKFIPNREQIQDIAVRTRYGIVASMVGIGCNLILFLMKLAVGLFLNSVAVMADAFNNLFDAASSIVSFVGMKMAGKPADKDHPFGHGRVEYIATFIVAFFVLEVGFTFLKDSVGKILEPESVSFQLIPFIILGISVFVKIWMGIFNKKLGRKINSKVLLATAADCMGDVIVTGATMVTLLIGYWFDIKIDGYTGVVVSLLVMWTGVNIAKDTLEPLIGEAADPNLCKQIVELVEVYEGVVGTHDLIVHNYGPNRSMASIHVEVPRDVDIEVAHEVIDQIEREVSKKLDIFLVIHMDPVEIRDQRLLHVKKQIECVLNKIDASVSFHDFRMVNGGKKINLIFDIVVPHGYSEEQIQMILYQIAEDMKKADQRYVCVITVDKSYVAEC